MTNQNICEERHEDPTESFRMVVRVYTTIWEDRKGIHVARHVAYQKKKSYGYQLQDLVADIGVEEVVSKLVGLDNIPDGLYQVEFSDVERNWEDNSVESYMLKLSPYLH